MSFKKALVSKFFYIFVIACTIAGAIETWEPLGGLVACGLGIVYYFLALLGLLPIAGPILYWFCGRLLVDATMASLHMPVTANIAFAVGFGICLFVQLALFVLLLLYFMARDIFERIMSD